MYPIANILLEVIKVIVARNVVVAKRILFTPYPFDNLTRVVSLICLRITMLKSNNLCISACMVVEV